MTMLNSSNYMLVLCDSNHVLMHTDSGENHRKMRCEHREGVGFRNPKKPHYVYFSMNLT